MNTLDHDMLDKILREYLQNKNIVLILWFDTLNIHFNV